MIYHFKSLVLVRKGRAFYATLSQEVFFANPGGGGSLKWWRRCNTPENMVRLFIHTVCIFMYSISSRNNSVFKKLSYFLDSTISAATAQKTKQQRVSSKSFVRLLSVSVYRDLEFIRCQATTTEYGKPCFIPSPILDPFGSVTSPVPCFPQWPVCWFWCEFCYHE